MQIEIKIDSLPIEGTAYQIGDGIIIHIRHQEGRQKARIAAPVLCPVPARFKRIHRSRRMGWQSI